MQICVTTLRHARARIFEGADELVRDAMGNFTDSSGSFFMMGSIRSGTFNLMENGTGNGLHQLDGPYGSPHCTWSRRGQLAPSPIGVEMRLSSDGVVVLRLKSYIQASPTSSASGATCGASATPGAAASGDWMVEIR